MSTRQCVHAYYSGRVQGIGFRYTAAGIARNLRIDGWVKNLRDGRVELCAEGPADALENVLAQLADEFRGNITHTDVDWEAARGERSGFHVIS
jgi:acylphosphatase